MQYENRQPEEGINVSNEHPLKLFIQLGVGALILVVALVVFLQVSGSFVAKRIPFGFELAVMNELDIDFGDNENHPQMVEYLNALSIRVIEHMELPDDMRITVHYNAQNIFNAFATVGGNVMFYKGLLEDIPDENTLAMVMAHEIAHVVHRDPMGSLGGGIASSIALLALTGSTGSNMAGSVLTNAGSITSVQFTRSMENAADQAALTALNSLYGHLNGASALFDMFSEARGPQKSSTDVLERFLSTHPRDEDRVNHVQERAEQEGWSLEGKLTPLPADFKSWL